jgi:hypothetical protein
MIKMTRAPPPPPPPPPLSADIFLMNVFYFW